MNQNKLYWIIELCKATIELELYNPSKDRRELLEMYTRQLKRNMRRNELYREYQLKYYSINRNRIIKKRKQTLEINKINDVEYN